MLQLNDLLLRFPLFYGLGTAELIEIVGHTKFDFQKHAPATVLASQGEPCRHLHLLTGGTLQVCTSSIDRQYSIEEEMAAPFTFQLESIYGLTQRYRSTFTAQTEVSAIVIDKGELTKLVNRHAALRTNLINLLSAMTQRQLALSWREAPTSLRMRLTRFFSDHSQQPGGPKVAHILMTRLAQEIGDSRRDVSTELHHMQDEGLLTLGRGKITLNEKLFQ